MHGPVRAVFIAAVLGLFVIGGVSLVPRSGDVGGPTIEASPSPSPSPTPPPARLRDGLLPAGTYVATPFLAPGSDAGCGPAPACSETIPDDDIRFTFTVPDGWDGIRDVGVGLTGTWIDGPTGAEIIFVRGAWPYDDPCQNRATAQIPAGSTAADFADALDAHPLLDVTKPVDISLAGYSGKYVELQVPNDPTIQGSSDGAFGEGCPIYRPWEPWYFAQGPGERWHLSILDVSGLRVVIQAMDHEGTSAQHRAELQAIVDSIEIEPPTAPVASPTTGPLAWSPASLEQDWPAPVRAEPDGDPVIVPLAGGYTDPSGDIESSDVPWVDIQSVTAANGKGRFWVDVVAIPPSPRGDLSNVPRIAYGQVFDTDLDGVADVRHGMDRVPVELTPRGGADDDWEVHAWRTDLRTGTTVSGSSDSSVCDCLYPDEFSHRAYIYPGQAIPGRFYVWASVHPGRPGRGHGLRPGFRVAGFDGFNPRRTPAASSPP